MVFIQAGTRLTSCCCGWAASAALAASAPRPAELDALLARARIEAPVAAWCAGEFTAGRPGGFAVAVASPGRGGRYLVLRMGDVPVELASFAGGADLACYSPAKARALGKSIAVSDTVHGRISPRWRTTVVCGFVENTNAVCWQFSPKARAFVKVGEWVT